MLLNPPSSALSERGRGEGLEVGTSLPSDQLGFGKTRVQLGFCKIVSLEGRPYGRLQRSLCIFQNGYFSFHLVGSMRGFFSLIITVRNLVALEIKLINVWEHPPRNTHTYTKDWAPLEFLTLKLVYTEPSEIPQLQFEVFLPILAPGVGFCSYISW